MFYEQQIFKTRVLFLLSIFLNVPDPPDFFHDWNMAIPQFSKS